MHCKLSTMNPSFSLRATPLAPTLRPRRRLNTVFCAAKSKKAPPPPEFLTETLHIELTETLVNFESMPDPLWPSFCGAVGGVWVGTTSAFAPFTGLPEPVGVAADGKTKLLSMRQVCVEARDVESSPDVDRLVRRSASATSAAQLSREVAAGGDLQFEPTASVDWDEEELAAGQPGLFVFDGGSYSVGPPALYVVPEEKPASAASKDGEPTDGSAAADAAAAGVVVSGSFNDEASAAGDELADLDNYLAKLDEAGEGEELDDEEFGELEEWVFEEEEPTPAGTTSVIETSLQLNGERRVRVKLTLNCCMLGGSSTTGNSSDNKSNSSDNKSNSSWSRSEPELDVSLLRVAVACETWEGAPGQFVGVGQQEEAQEAALAEACCAQRLKPADVAGFWNVFEVCASTIEDIDMRTGQQALLPLYLSREVQQHMQLSSDLEIQKKNKSSKAVLEGGVLWLPHGICVQLAQGAGAGGVGLEVTVLWRPDLKKKDGVLLGMTRRYSPEGALEGVTASTAVRAA